QKNYNNNGNCYLDYLKKLKKIAINSKWNPRKKGNNYFEDCIMELDLLSHWILVLFSFCLNLTKYPTNKDWLRKKERELCKLKLKIKCKSINNQNNHQLIIEEIIEKNLMIYDSSEKYLVNIKAINQIELNEKK